MVIPIQAGHASRHDDAHSGDLRLPGVEIADHRLLPEGDPAGRGQISRDRIITQALKFGERTRIRLGPGRPQRRRLGQGPAAEALCQFLRSRSGQGALRYVPTGEQDLVQKLAALAHPGCPDSGAQISGVHRQADIALQESATACPCQALHLLKAGPVQHQVGLLRISGGGQHLPGPEHRLAEHLAPVPKVIPKEILPQPLGIVPPALGEQTRLVQPHGLGLDQHLGVVVVVFQLKDLHQPPVRHRVRHVPEGVPPGIGQQLFQRRRGQLGQLAVSALAEHLGCFAAVLGVNHPLHPFPGQHAVFHRVDAGGDG